MFRDVKPAIVVVLGILGAVQACGTGAGSGQDADSVPWGPDAAVFHVTHEVSVQVPAHAGKLRLWLVRPRDTRYQTIRDRSVETSMRPRVVQDSWGNTYHYFEVQDPRTGTFRVTDTFVVERRAAYSTPDPTMTRPHTPEELARIRACLEPAEHVEVDAESRKLARRITDGERNPVAAARLIYEWILENVDIWVKDPENLEPSGKGSSGYCLEFRTGDAADLHALYMSLARSAGIPSRVVYGSLFKAPLAGVDKDQGRHCWIELHAPGMGWIPLDVALADIYSGRIDLGPHNKELVALTTPTGYAGPDPRMVEAYFGGLDPRRMAWTRGRDLILTPRQATGPINAIADAYVEIDGKEVAFARKLTFRPVD